LAILIGPSIGDFLTRGTDACAVAPCCAGKMSRSCPMHPHTPQRGEGMRRCGDDEQVAVAHHVVATFSAILKNETVIHQQRVPRRLATLRRAADVTPPDPPPPRPLSS
jgi:hypothetical protein